MDYDTVVIVGVVALGAFAFIALVLVVAVFVYLVVQLVAWLRSGQWRRDLWR